MSQKKILILNHVPIKIPTDGGMQRTWHIRQSLINAGSSVVYQSYYDQRNRKMTDIECYDKPVNNIELLKPAYLWEFDDFLLGEAIIRNRNLFHEFKTNLINFAPDIIVLEHLWLWLPLRACFAEKPSTYKIIYASHNVEYQIIKMLSKKYKNDSLVNQLLAKVEHAEMDLCQKADLVITASPLDEHTFRGMGAKKVVSFVNGGKALAPYYFTSLYQKLFFAHKKFALYISSNWKPNIESFCRYALAFSRSLISNQYIVVVGSCCDLIESMLAESMTQEYLQHFLFFGKITDAVLAGLYRFASCVILPINEGSGSNIKTAEALINANHIVGTRFAFRGFESYLHDTDIDVADSTEDFAQALMKVLQKKKTSRNKIVKRPELLWQNRFLRVPVVINAVQ